MRGVAMWLNIVKNDPQVTYCELLVLLPLCPTRGKSFYRETWGTRRSGGCHVAQLVRVVGIAPFAPQGVGTQGKFVLSSPRGVNGLRRPVPGARKQRYAKGEPGKVQGLDRVGIEESCGYRTRRVSIRG